MTKQFCDHCGAEGEIVRIELTLIYPSPYAPATTQREWCNECTGLLKALVLAAPAPDAMRHVSVKD
jgi:hypothetical protein